jgi:hypothetical protein
MTDEEVARIAVAESKIDDVRTTIRELHDELESQRARVTALLVAVMGAILMLLANLIVLIVAK